MSELVFSPVFREVTCSLKDQAFSAMYFNRHCGKNLLILKHDVTMLLVFGDENQWSTPEMTKTVSFRGNPMKGVEIVGSDDVILLLDEVGKLWRLINAFESYPDGNECLHSLNDSCFYEWVPFNPFHFEKILAVCGMERGFAFITLNINHQKRVVVLPSADSFLEDYTFDELGTSKSLNFHLVSHKLKIEDSIFKNEFETKENLLVTERSTGRTYLCGRNGRNYLLNQWSIRLISALHYPRESCFVLCYQTGKLVFYFYDKSPSHRYAYLPKEINFIVKCVCCESCLIWSDGVGLHHTRLSFEPVKVYNLEVKCVIESPLSVLLLHENALVVTVNNIYYIISAGVKGGLEIYKQPKEILMEISKYSEKVAKYELKTEMLAHYLYCKDLTQNAKVEDNIELRWVGNNLAIKSLLNMRLRQEFWKLRLSTSSGEMKVVKSVGLDCDLCEGMTVTIDNPFGCKCDVKVCLVGDFDGEFLYLNLGGIEGFEGEPKKDHLKKQLRKILKKRNPLFGKEC